jgi:hypothetical protein
MVGVMRKETSLQEDFFSIFVEDYSCLSSHLVKFCGDDAAAGISVDVLGRAEPLRALAAPDDPAHVARNVANTT